MHSLLLITAIGFSFLFAKSPLAQFDLQLSAILAIIFILSRRFFKENRLIESVVFTMIVFVIVNTTGGLTSEFFFLVYFLLFALALLLEPVVSIVTTLTAIIFFLVFFPQEQSLSNLIPLLSMALLTPFAMFMGQEYEKNLKFKIQNLKLREDTFLFLSLMLKNHLKSIKEAVENFVGDGQLHQIKRSAQNMDKLIEKFEKGN